MNFVNDISVYLNSYRCSHMQDELGYIANIRMVEKLAGAIFIVIGLFFGYYCFTLGITSVISIGYGVGTLCGLAIIGVMERIIYIIRREKLCPKCCLDKFQVFMKKRAESQCFDEFLKNSCEILNGKNGLWMNVWCEEDETKRLSMLKEIRKFIRSTLEDGKHMEVKSTKAIESFELQLRAMDTLAQRALQHSRGEG